MTYLFKYLKPFVPLLVLAVMFLALQAYGELTLPTYSADLVDSGISRGGIDSAAPEAMLSSTFDALISTTEKYDIFTETDREFLKNSYTKIYAGDEKYIKKYPVVSEQDIVVRNKLKTNEKENLSTVTGKALILLASMQQMMLSSTSPPPESIMEETMASVNQMSESTLLAATTEIIKQNYTTLGIDLDKFSNDYVIMNGLKMLGFAFIIMVAIVFESFLAGKIGAGFGRDIRRAIFEKIISFSANETDKFGTASLITRSTNDVQQVQMIVPMVLRFIVYAPILGIGGIIKVLATDVSMTWIIGLAVAVMSVIVVIMFLFAVPKFKIAQTLVDKVNLVMRESLNGLMVVRAFSNEQHEEKKFRKAASDLMNLNIFITKIMWTMMPLMMFLFNAVTLLIVWVGTKQIDAGNMEIGSMMAFISYSMQIISAFLMISMLSMMAPRAIVAGKRIADVLKTDVSVKDESNNTKLEKLNKATVQFKNVSFKYPGAEEYVLKNISFTAKPGETTAFIGSAGSGKSTLANLIPRFYDVTEGEILMDGKNIKEITMHDLREQIGYVPQKAVLFSGTIASNIKFSGNVSDEQMLVAAETAQAEDFINEKPDKYEDAISQGGTNVSGGQKQRLSIARALAKKPPVYIFDDSFSALDYKTDSALRAALKKNTSNATLLIVAQRIGTIKNAEQIVVLEQGEVVGRGTHRELLENCEIYKQIALSQLSAEELEKDMKQ